MNSVTMMFGHSVPNIGFLTREGTGKEEKLLGYTNFGFCIFHMCRGILDSPPKKFLGGELLNFKKFTKDYTKTLLL